MRIYQGRVSKVQRLKPLAAGEKAPKGRGSKPEHWVDWPEGEKILWQHHEVFQDGVNYYTLMLAAMARGVEGDAEKARAARRWSDQVRDSWVVAYKKSLPFPGPRARIAGHLNLDPHSATFEQCAEAVFRTSASTSQQRAAAVLRLLELAGSGDAALNKLAVEKLPFLCSAPEFFSAGDDRTANAQLALRQEQVRRIHAATPETLIAAARQIDLDCFLRTPPTGHYTGEKAARRLRDCFAHITEGKPGKPARFPALKSLAAAFESALTQLLQTSPAALSMPQAKRPPAEFHPTAVFRFLPTPETWAACQSATAGVLDREVITGMASDPLTDLRVGGQPAFPYFTNLALRLPAGRKPSRAVWFEFDLAAFIEAIKAPHRYFQDAQKRETAANKLHAKLDALEGNGNPNEDDEDEEDDAGAGQIGFAGDPRIDLLVDLVWTKLYVGEAEDSEEPVEPRPFIRTALARRGLSRERHRVEYSIQERTLRGYAEIRTRWRELHAKGEASEARLLEVRDAVQGKHRDDFGSASLYEWLAKPEYHPIWRDAGSETWHAEDPLAAWRHYTELRFELADKNRPIRFTPAHPEKSPRYFIVPKSGTFGARHESGLLALTCGIAAPVDNAYEPCNVRLLYSAPRLLRDGLRAAGDTDLTAAPFLQPMMQALGVPEPDRQDFSNCRVTLQPEKRKPKPWLPSPDKTKESEYDIQLTFPIEIVTAKLTAFLGKADFWRRQFNQHPDGDSFYPVSLRWPHEEKSSKLPIPWYEKLTEGRFSCAAFDLGQRDAGAFVVMEARANYDFGGRPARCIGETPGRVWRAQRKASGTLRLSGENREEWRESKPKARDFAWQQEQFGRRGRPASDAETDECARLLAELGSDAKEFMPETRRRALSFPQQNDKLLIAARRTQAHLARVHRWCWFLTDPKQAAKIETALKEINETDDRPLFRSLRQCTAPERREELRAKLRAEIAFWKTELPRILTIVANRCLPLRDRSWKWDQHSASGADAASCFLLSQAGPPCPNARRTQEDGTVRDATWIRGHRGLSFARIEQIEELRRRFQSLNQSLRRNSGGPPLKRRDETIPDPCPDLLGKLERIKKQRINQTAHMILAEALGLRLAKPPANKNELRQTRDQHGVYEKILDARGHWRGPVDFIVIEDLSRYRATQGRAPRENSRLMKWCHRAVRDKLKQLCEIFGLPVVETPAAYSSRFCSRSGVPGFRAEEVTAHFTETDSWRWLANRKTAENEPTAEARRLLAIDVALQTAQARLEHAWQKSGKTEPCPQRTLLVPKSLGPLFVPISDQTSAPDSLAPRLDHADINAATNLALRAMADPRIWSIHPRLRTQRGNETKPGKGKKSKRPTAASSAPQTEGLFTREKRKFGETRLPITLSRADATADDTRQPNFFADFADTQSLADEWLKQDWTTANLHDVRDAPPLVHGKSFWGCVKALQWSRIGAINDARLRAWRQKLDPADSAPGHPEL